MARRKSTRTNKGKQVRSKKVGRYRSPSGKFVKKHIWVRYYAPKSPGKVAKRTKRAGKRGKPYTRMTEIRRAFRGHKVTPLDMKYSKRQNTVHGFFEVDPNKKALDQFLLPFGKTLTNMRLRFEDADGNLQYIQTGTVGADESDLLLEKFEKLLNKYRSDIQGATIEAVEVRLWGKPKHDLPV